MGQGMSDAPRQQPPKKEVALALLEESSMFIHLDPRRPDVLVPKWFMGQPQLVLQVGLNMAIPIPDLKVDDFGISCTLSFNRAPFWCRIPWTAIYALVGEDGRGGVWADDVPPEIQRQKPSTPPKAAKKQRPKLTVARDPEEAAPEAEKPSRPAAEPLRAAPKRALQAVPVDDGIVEDEPPRPAAPAPARAESEEQKAGEPAAPGSADAGSPGPDAPAKKTKREIPPYLRRIK